MSQPPIGFAPVMYQPAGAPPGYMMQEGPPPYNQPGYPGGGYPPAGQPGYPPPGQPGYPPPGQPGYPPPQGGYPPAGYPPAGQPGYPAPGQPVTQQPQGQEWMSVPQGVPHCPPGLEYLTMIDQLLVKQKVELMEAFTGFETNNKYKIMNSMGQKVYYAKEKTDCCTRNCCGPYRPFDMKIEDNSGNEVIHLYRPLMCDSCWFPCCLQKLEVYSPPGTLVGSVEQQWSLLYPVYHIKNAAGDPVLKIKGPICTWSICGDVEFDVMSMDGGTNVGAIRKQWSGFAREAFTDSDNFGITFPMDLDVKMKAVMLGAVFLIDFMFFEKTRDSKEDAPGMF